MIRTTYNPSFSQAWDTLVSGSRNGTFLFKRPFMDYHADRFHDCSLLYYKEEHKLLGAFPASCRDVGTVVSHGGLTYGGIIVAPEAHAEDVGQMLEMALDYYRSQGYRQLIVKPVPYIYHRQPCDDELYWLFRHGATLTSRSLSTTVNLRTPLPFSNLRRRKAKKAKSEGLQHVLTTDIVDYQRFWVLLTDILQRQHNRLPVHTLDEILLLQSRFPRNIVLHIVTEPTENRIIAGTLLFLTDKVVHAQYIAASQEGRDLGALDFLFEQIIAQSAQQGYDYFDFGISTEDDGRYLNAGLNFQKEGFGGRSIVYDAYTIQLQQE